MKLKKKYRFTGGIRNLNGKVLQRIQRLSDDKVGGWIESDGNVEVCGDAKIEKWNHVVNISNCS